MQHFAKFTVGIALFLGMAFSPGHAEASTVHVTVDSVNYEIGLIAGTYNDLSDTLEDQPWYLDDDDPGYLGEVANDFALAVGGDLGSPNFGGGQGPYFAFLYDTNNSIYQRSLDTGSTLTNAGLIGLDTEFTFAVVVDTTAIPVPAALPLLLGGLGALTVLRQSRRRLG